MQETLYDRFRPFKPYDLILAILMLLLVAPNSVLPPVHTVLMVIAGACTFCLLSWIQRYVRLPAPAWISLTIVGLNTLVVGTFVFLQRAHQLSLAFAILNTAFATVAFGQHSGIVAAVLSVALLWNYESNPGEERYVYFQAAVFTTILITLVAILTRMSRLQRDALFDVVTKLRNHRYFQVRLREELDRSRRYGRPTALLMLDLDNFKRVNDGFGHAVGDQVLRQISELIMNNSRAADVVCRYGGEEIAVILPETALTEAGQVAERLREAIEKRQDDKGTLVTVSAGVAVCPDHGPNADVLIAAADAAMYRAKREGKNRVVVAESWLTDAASE